MKKLLPLITAIALGSCVTSGLKNNLENPEDCTTTIAETMSFLKINNPLRIIELPDENKTYMTSLNIAARLEDIARGRINRGVSKTEFYYRSLALVPKLASQADKKYPFCIITEDELVDEYSSSNNL